MKNLYLVFGIAVAAIIIIVVYSNGHKNDVSEAKASATGHAIPRKRLDVDASSFHELNPASSASRRATDPDGEKEDIRKLRRELETAKAQLEKITRPLGQDVLSSTVNAEINPGETLVTGGYKTADGNYELTFVTPRSVTLEGGREAIEIEGKVLSVGSEFVGAHGLESLATNAKNTLQHAEAWMQDDVASTLVAARDAERSGILSSPKVVTLPSNAFSLSFGEANGAQFSLEGNVARSTNGSFAIQFRVERTPAEYIQH